MTRGDNSSDCEFGDGQRNLWSSYGRIQGVEVSTESSSGPSLPKGQGDFAQWVAPSVVAMTRLASRLVPAPEVDDVVQNTLVRAWLKRDKYDPARGSATTWLLAIVADQARTSRRSARRRNSMIDEFAILPDTPDARRLPPEEADLDATIAELPKRQQLAVHLHYFIGLSVQETAQVMNCTSGTVKSTLFNARHRLRTTLGDHDAH